MYCLPSTSSCFYMNGIYNIISDPSIIYSEKCFEVWSLDSKLINLCKSSLLYTQLFLETFLCIYFNGLR